MGAIVPINYGSIEARLAADQAATRIRGYMRKTVGNLADIGRELEEMKKRLPHGTYEPWVVEQAGLSLAMAHRCRRLALFVQSYPEILSMSIEAALRYPELEPGLQARILEQQASTWTAFSRVVDDWTIEQYRERMDKHLEEGCGGGEPCDPDRWAGEVFHWAREDMGSDDPATARAAKAYYEEHRNEWARMSDRTPRELDAEVGYTHEKPAGQSGHLYPNTEGLRVGRCGPDGEFLGWVDQIEEVVRLWGGAAGPKDVVYLAPNGPGSRAWIEAWIEAGSNQGLVMRTPATIQVEVDSVYGETL